MSNDYIQRLKRSVLEMLKDEEVKIIIFGSRARKDGTIASDIDIGIIPKGEFDRKKLVLLRELIEDINIPYKIDIVDFSFVSEGFKKEALKEVESWKD